MRIRLEQALLWEKQCGTMKEHRTFRKVKNRVWPEFRMSSYRGTEGIGWEDKQVLDAQMTMTKARNGGVSRAAACGMWVLRRSPWSPWSKYAREERGWMQADQVKSEWAMPRGALLKEKKKKKPWGLTRAYSKNEWELRNLFSSSEKRVKAMLGNWEKWKAIGGHNVFFWFHTRLWTENRRERGLCLICHCALLSSTVITGLAPGFSFKAIYSETLVFRI